MRATLGPEVTPLAEGREVPSLGVAYEHDPATVPAITAIGPATWHMRLTAEADAAVATCAALDPDSCLIEKHLKREYRACSAQSLKPTAPAAGGSGAVGLGVLD